ncbi:MAG TPA: hypothetical protein DCE42_14180 [Myxococcales bacterium]|nr:hypothetical protein [Deltaproteobacteria bacterium]HAA55907.1 hypothetical protein [Myxococcales bacterium]|tara:strand:- start:9220 stop:9912 length:693 start_codon:yes stop_codon:yes gene_type:complete
MKRIQFSLCFVVTAVFCMAASASSFAAEKDPMSLLKETQKKVQSIIEQNEGKSKKARRKKAKEIQKLIEPFFDFDQLAKRALGDHWEKRTKDERTSYQFWVKALIKNAYFRSLSAGIQKKQDKDVGVRYKKQKIKKSKATVFTRVRYKDPRSKKIRKVRVEWIFLKKGKSWLVGDIVTNDNSLVETYEEQFDKIIRKKSFKELIKRIQTKVNEIRKKEGLKPLIDPVAKK